MSLPTKAGISLKSEHYNDILCHAEKADEQQFSWLEIHPENYFGQGGEPHHYLEKIRAKYPISMHGVGLSLGSSDGLEKIHLDHLKTLIERYEPAQVSEHVSWSMLNGAYLNDLLPIPYNEESFTTVRNNILQTQEHLNQSILVENPSTYLQFDHDTLIETEFLNQLCKETDCGILLDINNIAVCTFNHSENSDSQNNKSNDKENSHISHALAYLDKINYKYVGEIHLAGHKLVRLTDEKEVRIDDHGSKVSDEVWSLYTYALKQAKRNIPTLIEWDTDVPNFDVLTKQSEQAQKLLDVHCTQSA